MVTLQNPYKRLQEYYSLLKNGQANLDPDENCSEFGLSMTEIASITKIPLKIVRNDFQTIFEFQFSLNKKAEKLQNNKNKQEIIQENIFVFSEDSIPEDDANDPFCIYKVINRFNESYYQKYFIKYLKDGTFDNLPIALSTRHSEDYMVYLSTEEAQALNTQKAANSRSSLYERFSETYEDLFQIKDSFRYLKNNEKTNQLLEIINEAISTRRTLEMSYKPSAKPLQNFILIPIKLAYDATDNSFYVLSVYQDKIYTYRLDRIVACTPSKNKLPYPDQSVIKKLSEIAPQVWGCSFSDPPMHVKVKFKNVANVWKKVRNELAYRTKGSIYEDGDWLYYEDTIYGIYKFRSWVYGYGRAAVVLEPQELRIQIIESLKERLMS